MTSRLQRPFRFLAEARAVASGRDLAATARRAEDLGIDVLVVPDHLIDQLAPIPALATVAAATDRLRIAAFVLNNDLRHPAVLAQELASLDVLSGGRLEVAIGAGWNKSEYDAIGVPYDGVRTRQARLAEAITVLKGCFAAGAFSFAGEHYSITDYDAQPRPVQRPHPPFFIGGGGRRTLELAAREAQIVGLAPRLLPGPAADPDSITFAATAEKIGWVREAAGERVADLEFNVYPSMVPLQITDHPLQVAEEHAARIAAASGRPVDPPRSWTHPTSSSARWTRCARSSSGCVPTWASVRSWWARSTTWRRSWRDWRAPSGAGAGAVRARARPGRRTPRPGPARRRP